MLKTKIYLIQKILRIINQNVVNVTMIYVFFIKIIFALIANAYYCSKCLQNHFNKCLTLFFIPSSDIGFICTDHNKKYEYFHTICNMNLCQKCKVEHEHYTKYSLKPLNKEEKQKIEIYTLLDKKIIPYLQI